MPLEIVDIQSMSKKLSKNYIEYKNIIRSYTKIPYFEQPNCARYTDYIKEGVESVFNNITKDGNIDERADFYMEIDGKRLKVKHLTSSRHIYCNDMRKDRYYWVYYIDHNSFVDAFLLSAFDNRNSINFQHLWLIKSNIVFELLYHRSKRMYKYKDKEKIRSKKKFWNREKFTINDFPNFIEQMEKYELKVELKKLKKLKFIRTEKEHKDLAHALLIEKQKEIFDKTDTKRSIEYLIEESIEISLGKRFEISSNNDDSVNVAVQKMLKKRLREEEGRRKGILQEEYENEAYNLIIERQKDLFDKTGDLKSIKEILNEGIEAGIDRVI